VEPSLLHVSEWAEIVELSVGAKEKHMVRVASRSIYKLDAFFKRPLHPDFADGIFDFQGVTL
jgi:hypothetical protein